MSTEIISKTAKIVRPAEEIYAVLSDFTRLLSEIPPELKNEYKFTVTSTECTVQAKNGCMGLRIIDQEPPKMLKYESVGKLPFSFLLWVQLKQKEFNDTRMRIVMRANLNAFTKMVLSKKLETGINELVDRLAQAMNRGL